MYVHKIQDPKSTSQTNFAVPNQISNQQNNSKFNQHLFYTAILLLFNLWTLCQRHSKVLLSISILHPV